MDQALYILNDDFFDKKGPVNLDEISEKIESLTQSERVIMVYDPFCGSLFQKQATLKQEEKLRNNIIGYYGALEKINKRKLSWYQLNEFLSYHMQILNDIMISVDFMAYSISSIGCLPLTISGTRQFLFYHLNPYYEVPDKLYMIKEEEYMKCVGDLWEVD